MLNVALFVNCNADFRKQTISLDYSADRTWKGSKLLSFGNMIEIPDENKSIG